MAAAARALAVAAALLASSSASGQERFDHRGAVGLLTGAGGAYKEGLSLAGVRDGGLRYDLELGGSLSIGYDGDELLALARLDLDGQNPEDWALAAGYRGYFGQDRLKTFFDLQVQAHFTPAFSVGPRLGLGVQYELLSVLGAYAALAVQLGGGNGFRFSAEATVGLQFRSYLLE